MQTLNDRFDENQKRTNRRPKSSSRFPKQMPSYIVAFAVHETYDDIATAQQMICNKRSLQGSASSVSPAISSKTILDQIPAPKTPEVDFIETPDEVKDIEEDIKNDRNDDNLNDLPETMDYFVVDNKEEKDVNQLDDNINVIKSNQIKHQKNRLSKKKRLNHYKIKNVNFKYKKSLKKDEMCNKKPGCAAKFRETFYSNSVSKVVSRTSLLKSVVAKENIRDAIDLMHSDDDNNNDESLYSSPSTTKKSFISYSSDDTLTRQGSTSSKNEDLYSINTVSSVIKIPSQQMKPFKAEVMNVSVAVAYNPSSKDNEYKIQSSDQCRSLYERDLMSTETLIKAQDSLTSDSGSCDIPENVKFMALQVMNESNTSEKTLKPNANSENTYVVNNANSETDVSFPSESTLAPNSETFMYAENLRQTPPILEKETKYNRVPLLDTVINMGIFPEINPSTSSAANFNDELNSVFVTGDSGKFSKSPLYKGKHFVENNLQDSSKYVFKKSFDANKDVNSLKNVNLPNESTIKAIIDETDKIDSKFCSGELGNYPGNMTELWDRLVLVVDSAVKRLEYSLTDKIIAEIRNSLPIFEKQNALLKEEVYLVDVEKLAGNKVLSNKEVYVERNEIQNVNNESLQCALVGNQAIDDIMLKLSVEGPKANFPGSTTKSFPKLKKQKIFRDYFEVLKPPTVESAMVKCHGDTVTVSTTTPSEIQEVGSFSRVKAILSGPMTFLRENMLVVTSVPTFFVMLLCVYGVIVFIMKPW